jgi:hypothetical protein
MEARNLWAALHLLDRQLADRDGISAGRVDDLLFREPDDDEDLPVLTHLLTGMAALAERFGSGGVAAQFELLRRVEDPTPSPGPAAIDMADVREIGPAIHLGLSRDQVPNGAVDRWLARTILVHIPGSGVDHDVDPQEKAP